MTRRAKLWGLLGLVGAFLAAAAAIAAPGDRSESAGNSAGSSAGDSAGDPGADFAGDDAGAAPTGPTVDYDPASKAWNGLASLVATAQKVDIELETRSAVQWDQLDERTVLVLVAPQISPTAEQLAELRHFLTAGGRLIVADDFRQGRGWVAPFGIVWSDLAVQSRQLLEGSPHLPMVEVAGSAQDLARSRRWTSIQARFTPQEFLGHNLRKPVVLNHPASLRLEAGSEAALWGRAPLAGEPDPGAETGWLAEAEYRGGRVLAIADASWLINQMIGRVYENRQFAANVLRYYCVMDRPCKVQLVTSATAATGTFAARYAPPPPGWRSGLEALEKWLRDINRLLQGPLLVPALLALALALIGLPVALLARQKGPALPPPQERRRAASTLAETVAAWLQEPRADYRKPASLLALQLSRLLDRVTAEPLPSGPHEPAGARRASPLRRSGGLVEDLVRGGRCSPHAGQRLRQVLSDLQQVSQDDAPEVTRLQFGQLAAEVEWAESLLRYTQQTRQRNSAAGSMPSESEP